MNFLKAIGYAFVAALVTILALFSSVVISVISTIVSVLLVLAGVFTFVYFLIWESSKKPDK